MRVLGLDPSLTNYGWALHDTEAKGAARCIERGRFRTKPRDFPDEISRYLHLRESLEALIERLDPDAMGLESPVLNESYSEGMYGLFLFSLEAIRGHAQDVVLFAPPQVKSFAKEILNRPKGWKMGKADMVEAAKEDVSDSSKTHGGAKGKKGHWDHNEADAYHVARAAGRFWSLYSGSIGEDELTPVEERTFIKTHTYVRGKKAGQTEKKSILHRENDRFFIWSIA